MATPACILVYGSDASLLRTRTMVLEQGGFPVVSAMTPAEVQAAVQDENIALIVLCHSLSDEAWEWCLDYAAEQQPALATLTLTARILSRSQTTRGAVLSVYEGPRKLVSTVRQLAAAY